MKTRLSVLALAMCSILAFTSCDDDDDNYQPDQTITRAFDSKYPNAGRVEWEYKHGYEVAEFYVSGNETEAWFDNNGNWVMTKTELNYGQLPEAVRQSLATGEYANWRTSDYDRLERSNAATIYVIEAELGNAEVDLYYTEDGILIRYVNENGNGGNDNFQPIVIPQAITDIINEKYPGSTILDFDSEFSGIEVDILHNNIHKDLFFNTSNEWVYTEWDIYEANVPAIIMNALRASEYSNYRIDDIDFIEKPTGTFYVFDLEQGNNDIKMTFNAEGTIVDIRRD